MVQKCMPQKGNGEGTTEFRRVKVTRHMVEYSTAKTQMCAQLRKQLGNILTNRAIPNVNLQNIMLGKHDTWDPMLVNVKDRDDRMLVLQNFCVGKAPTVQMDSSSSNPSSWQQWVNDNWKFHRFKTWSQELIQHGSSQALHVKANFIVRPIAALILEDVQTILS